MIKLRWSLTALLSLLLFAGFAAPVAPYTISGVIKDTHDMPVSDAEIGIFDGFTIQRIRSDDKGAYSISRLPVSDGLYAVLFFTRDGFVPSIINVKKNRLDSREYPVTMKRAESEKSGYIAGVVYQPVKGGKIRYQSGINRFGQERSIWLEGDGIAAESRTNKDGQFILEVPAGRYVLRAEGAGEKQVVEAVAGKTVIRNIRSGIVLID
ncbi:MAG: carboxypeptidase regulatory-like domain-containing protein [Nitrospirae bacterium]|nr:carboxypeptidase regulatory-like domain-containing protein [Nitrospirota bacterium]